MGQLSQHHQQIQCLQHTFNQGPIYVFLPTVIGTKTPTQPYVTQQMQLPSPGFPQVPNQNGLPTQPTPISQ